MTIASTIQGNYSYDRTAVEPDWNARYLGLPFGGTESSGTRREALSEELRSYTEQKSVTVTL